MPKDPYPMFCYSRKNYAFNLELDISTICALTNILTMLIY